jgi:hypothetical protein
MRRFADRERAGPHRIPGRTIAAARLEHQGGGQDHFRAKRTFRAKTLTCSGQLRASSTLTSAIPCSSPRSLLMRDCLARHLTAVYADVEALYALSDREAG